MLVSVSERERERERERAYACAFIHYACSSVEKVPAKALTLVPISSFPVKLLLQCQKRPSIYRGEVKATY